MLAKMFSFDAKFNAGCLQKKKKFNAGQQFSLPPTTYTDTSISCYRKEKQRTDLPTLVNIF